MDMKICQSCAMPLTDALLGTNADGSKSQDYCLYCYKDGCFTGNFTMEEMVKFCAQFVDEYNKNTGNVLSQEEYKDVLRQIYPNLKRWQLPPNELPQANSPLKAQLIQEINDLHISGLPLINNLFILQGSFINQEYSINGNTIKILNDSASYWGNQVENPNSNGRCFGIACDEKYILICEYGKDGENAEIILLKKR